WLERLENGTPTAADLQRLREILASQNAQVVQWGKYNINIGQGQKIQIGDRLYVEINDEAVRAIARAIETRAKQNNQGNYLALAGCSDRPALDRYLEGAFQRLQDEGCLKIQEKVIHDGRTFNAIAQISDFEPGLGMRGEAFFLFSEFASFKISTLRQYSGQCLQLAREKANPSAANQAFYNFRVPTQFCFAIALVDKLEEATAVDIQTTNPFKHRVDLLWYEIPVVYELSQECLFYYDKAAGFWENFRGEIAWKSLRTVIQRVLKPQ
ncbi:MAG: hypothetical protein VKL39_20740, partial [Leptolyngbyaceae bacterium]|nr:hypothetical protein [Leptolyngbyaceae bacterium]